MGKSRNFIDAVKRLTYIVVMKATAKQTAIAKMKASVAKRSTEMLKECAKMLMDITSEEANISFYYVLSELENRMPEPEYITFCDSL